MDDFKSLIVHGTPEQVCEEVNNAGTGEDELVVDTVAYGWHDGGMERALRQYSGGRTDNTSPLFFRGHALFNNIDDAKNDYLMEPEVETPRGLTAEEQEQAGLPNDDYEKKHVPFGMIMPHWRDKTHEELRAQEQHDPREELVGVTLILWWQELC
jgi:hypothetical protein